MKSRAPSPVALEARAIPGRLELPCAWCRYPRHNANERERVTEFSVVIVAIENDQREVLRMLVEGTSIARVRATIESFPMAANDAALRRAKDLKPDVVLLDIVMPGMDGIRAARALRLIGCDSKIIFLSGIEDLQVVEAALATTANGFVFKSRIVSDLSRAIADVLSGKVFVSGKESMPPASAKSGETSGGVARLWRFN